MIVLANWSKTGGCSSFFELLWLFCRSLMSLLLLQASECLSVAVLSSSACLVDSHACRYLLVAFRFGAHPMLLQRFVCASGKVSSWWLNFISN